MNDPCITIVTVVYNARGLVEKTIQSIISQTYVNTEYIVVDGGSKDGTLDIIQLYSNKITSWISEPDNGIYDAMNKGVKMANGEWIGFIHAGDTLASNDTLSIMAGSLSPEVDVLYGNALYQYEGFTKRFPNYPLIDIWKHTPFCHQASLAKKKLLLQWPFDLRYKIGADYDFISRCYHNHRTFKHVEATVCHFDATGGTTKLNIVRAIRDKRDIALKFKNSWRVKIYYKLFINYARIIGYIKKLFGQRITNLLIRNLKQ